MNTEHEVMVSIDTSHPALAGHFPGNPIVPAVVILGEVFKALRKTTNYPIQVVAIPHAKFLSPLKPEETLAIRLESEDAGEVTFTCRVGSRLISAGSLRFSSLAE